GYLMPVCPTWPGVMCDYRYHHHRSTAYEFLTRTPIRDAHAREFGWRSGRGFIPNRAVSVLKSWDDLIALKVKRDEFGKPHRDGCTIIRCNGCSNGITVLIDELNLWAPSRLWQELGIGVLNRWAYVRKDGLEIIWTA